MSKQIFNNKDMDRINSPEQLNTYIRVSNVGVWLVLSAIVVLLLGVCVWGIFGRLDTTLNVVSVAENDTIFCYIAEEDIYSIAEGMTVYINEKEYHISDVEAEPIAVDSTMSDYMLHIGDLQVGEWVYIVNLEGENLANGIYHAEVVIESIAPLSFIWN
ncbi:MAG: hypothetical protein IKJ01_04200 [Lachnospiraceae bacterium]|nr:hypothetical protein [Lachnospiraceae bacterium]